VLSYNPFDSLVTLKVCSPSSRKKEENVELEEVFPGKFDLLLDENDEYIIEGDEQEPITLEWNTLIDPRQIQ